MDIQSVAPQLHARKATPSVAQFSEKSVSHARLSFTYFPNGNSHISAIKLTERDIGERDVLTIYYTQYSLFFTGMECQKALNYKRDDMIFNREASHTAQLHKPEDPAWNEVKQRGWHCHITVERGSTIDFVRRLFNRHHVNPAQQHTSQFTHSATTLRKETETRGLNFADGSYTENAECLDLNTSIPTDRTAFEQAELPN